MDAKEQYDENYNYSPSPIEIVPSAEQLEAVRVSLDTLLGKLEPSRIEECKNGFYIRNHEATMPLGTKIVCISALTLQHQKALNPIQRTYVSIRLSSEENISFDDFELIIQDNEPLDGRTFEIGGDNIAVVEPHEEISYIDYLAIYERQEQILADPNFDDFSSRGVFLPSLRQTPSGDVYQEGIEVADTTSPKSLHELSTSCVSWFGTEEEALRHQRRMAAYHKASQEVGDDLTSERAEKITQFLNYLIGEMHD